MEKEFFKGNRQNFYKQMKENSLLVMFSGLEIRKTNDEFYPFYTNRNFLYLTGLDSKELILLARKDGEGNVREKIFLTAAGSVKRALDRGAHQAGRSIGDFGDCRHGICWCFHR